MPYALHAMNSVDLGETRSHAFMINKKGLTLAISILISLGLLVGSFYKINFSDFFLSLKKLNFYSLFFCMLFIGMSYVAKAFMWRVTTIAMKRISISTLFGGIVVGCMVNGVLPFRAGELFRAQYLSSMTGLRRTSALGTIFIERLMDVNSLGLLLLLSYLLGIQGLSRNIVGIVFLVWLIVFMIAAVLIMNSKKIEENKDKLRFVPQRFLNIFFHFLETISQLRDLKKILSVAFISLFSWLFTYLSLLSLIYYSGATVIYQASLLLFLFLNIGFLIPAAPGALGVVQVAFWFALSPFGVPKEQALALSFIYLFVAYILNSGVGLPFFLRAHLWSQRKVPDEFLEDPYKNVVKQGESNGA